MKEDAKPVNAMVELTPEVRRFLAGLRDEDVQNLKHGLKLVSAFQTLGWAAKWLVLTLGGLLVGVVMLGESVNRIWQWLRPPH